MRGLFDFLKRSFAHTIHSGHSNLHEPQPFIQRLDQTRIDEWIQEGKLSERDYGRLASSDGEHRELPLLTLQ